MEIELDTKTAVALQAAITEAVVWDERAGTLMTRCEAAAVAATGSNNGSKAPAGGCRYLGV